VDAAGACVGAYEVEDAIAAREVEVAAAEEVLEGFVVPAFADQEEGGVVREGRGLWVSKGVLLVSAFSFTPMWAGSVCQIL
jgi:hypothetical protein